MAITLCDALLSAEITKNCANPIFGGFEQIGVIINRADIDFANLAYDPTNENIITALTLKSGKKGFNIYMPTNQPFPVTTEAVVGTSQNKWTSHVSFNVLDNGPSIVNSVIEPLANGEFVIVLQHKYKNDDNVFEVFGIKKGLRLETLVREEYNSDTEGGWAVTMQEAETPQAALFMFDTNYATTLSDFAALTTAV